MKYLVNGALGRMGQAVINSVKAQGGEVVAVDCNFQEKAGYKSVFDVIEKVDVIIDFSFHTATKQLLEYAIKNKIPCVIATTGHTEEEKKDIINASKIIPVFYSGNMSVGIALLSDLVKKAVKVMDKAEVEIIEIHHDKKVDAPSGTALMLFDAVKSERPNSVLKEGRSGNCLRQENEVGISSVRIASVVGVHEVIVSDGKQTITLKHEAHDRALFADGALKAGNYLIGKTAGLYDMKKMLGDL
ncbi:MAG TPA: 4-hydroxy-tetrahydrodipicolinate reductase [Clostridiales bacterium]|nr:4-hydroxy-tetrahydrodipicolinate reductase [Clostridiales bacterium]HBJ97707.1 4-hydroxy-tetrahydrodipicolinate reductase [Clostridiales bacterium]